MKKYKVEGDDPICPNCHKGALEHGVYHNQVNPNTGVCIESRGFVYREEISKLRSRILDMERQLRDERYNIEVLKKEQRRLKRILKFQGDAPDGEERDVNGWLVVGDEDKNNEEGD